MGGSIYAHLFYGQPNIIKIEILREGKHNYTSQAQYVLYHVLLMQRSASLGAIFSCLQFNLTVYLNKIVRKFKNLEESLIYFHLK